MQQGSLFRKQFSMSDSFSAVLANDGYIPLLVTYTKQDAEINSLRKAGKDDLMKLEPEYFSALEALNRSKCILLVGDSGMGKTTFLKMLCICMEGELENHPKYNLAKITEPVVRTETGIVLEVQKWDDGALRPFLLDLESLALEDRNRKKFPDEVKDAELILIDGADDIDPEDWKWVASEIEMLHAEDPDRYFVIACEADVMNRLRPRLPGFTSYTVKTLTDAQKHLISKQSSDDPDFLCNGLMPKVPMELSEALKITQSYLSWTTMDPKPQSVQTFFEAELEKSPLAKAEPEFTAYKYFTQKMDQREQQKIFASFQSDMNLLRYLACKYCLEENFNTRFEKLVMKLNYQSWAMIRMLKMIAKEKNAENLKSMFLDLCPNGEPKAETSIKALIAADLLFEIRDKIDILREKKVIQLKKWIRAIVENGWLTVYDRIIAGKRLSWLGDDRELTELVSIPAGSFTMGDYLLPNNQPVAEIKIKAFKIGRYAVVNTTYKEFIDQTGRFWLSEEKDNCERRNYPAINLTWYDAVAFCNWLTEKWQEEGKIGHDEIVRLPTEAEWEYAARGKIISQPDTLIYAWGSGWQDDYCNTRELGLNDTCAVGLFPQNESAFGCLDMNGMVWEWNSTLWGTDPKRPDYPYPYDPGDGRENTKDAPDNIRRCMRGGSFGSTADHATCCYRGGLEPIGFWRGDGFRIVVSKDKNGTRS